METIKINTVSTLDAVCNALENDILCLRFAPGEKITESELAMRYGVSRNTLREAIAHLIAQGLLTKIANKGVYVRRFTVEDIREIFHLRALLEQEAVRTILDKKIDISNLYSLVEKLEAIDSQKQWDEYVRADIDFHNGLVAVAGSPRLLKLFHSIITEVKLCIYQTRHFVPTPQRNSASHRTILDAISGGNEQAVMLLNMHIEHVIHRYCAGIAAMDNA